MKEGGRILVNNINRRDDRISRMKAMRELIDSHE